MQNKSFTLLEALLALGIFSLLFFGATSMTQLFSQDNIVARAQAKTIQSALQSARLRATRAEQDTSWGLYMKHETARDYAILFSGGSYLTAQTQETLPLDPRATFSGLTENGTQEIVFEKSSGSTTSTTVVIASRKTGKAFTISVPSFGAIEVQ